MNPANVAFRVDASDEIGTGHVMRCLALADELRERGIQSLFVCRAHPGHMSLRVVDAGHKVQLLPVHDIDNAIGPGCSADQYAGWLGADPLRDASDTAMAVDDFDPAWLVIDHYAIGINWEREFRTRCAARIMVIDGMANRAHDCDLLLDPTYSVNDLSRWSNLVPATCILRVGPRFAPLRREFHEARRSMRSRTGRVHRVFVAFGGVDRPNATAVVLSAVADLIPASVSVDVVVGGGNPHRSDLEAQCRRWGNVSLHVDPPNVAALMAKADLAISSGGTLLTEQCYLGLPALVVSIADNQVRPAQALHELGAVWYVGPLDPEVPGTTQAALRLAFRQLLASPERLLNMEAAANGLMGKKEKGTADGTLSTPESDRIPDIMLT